MMILLLNVSVAEPAIVLHLIQTQTIIPLLTGGRL